MKEVAAVPLKMACLIPAYNEAGGIGSAIQALLRQTRVPDLVVVVPNGCTDETATIARGFIDDRVKVFELPKLEHKKAEALNRAWFAFARGYDVVVAQDADSQLAPDACERWEREFLADRRRKPLGASSAKFSMPGKGVLASLQRAEFAGAVDRSLLRGWTPVNTGAGTAYNGRALRALVDELGTEGPWPYGSLVEDYNLTVLLRQRGWLCRHSPTVRAETDPMPTIRALWGQRMKWQTGTVADLMSFGVSKTTLYDWGQQAWLWVGTLVRVMAILSIGGQLAIREILFDWKFWLVPLGLEAAKRVFAAFRIHRRTWRDVFLAFILVPSEVYGWLSAAWFINAYRVALLEKVTGEKQDLWTRQYLAEGHLKTAVVTANVAASVEVSVRIRVARRRGLIVRAAELVALAALAFWLHAAWAGVNIKDLLDVATWTFFTALVVYNAVGFVLVARLLPRWGDDQRP